jgi:hypothetical protein
MWESEIRLQLFGGFRVMILCNKKGKRKIKIDHKKSLSFIQPWSEDEY